ncbi:hypothetical protein [Natrinema sp. DC36]|uniref:hypothetical protein n=1 Tax=Natrinema sp. DC36 TaxID=2878680 RepID=UPI001CEFBEC1|nr:hypothetical protein [Natrinema sp. DC36]
MGDDYPHIRSNHKMIQKKLKERLCDYVEVYYENPSTVSVGTERWISPPQSGKRRKIDVVIDIKDTVSEDLKGIAFEIKSQSSSGMQKEAINQLYDYSIAGYSHVLVAPKWLYLRETRYNPSLEWTIKPIKASYLEIIDDDPYRFALQEDRISVENSLAEFFV